MNGRKTLLSISKKNILSMLILLIWRCDVKCRSLNRLFSKICRFNWICMYHLVTFEYLKVPSIHLQIFTWNQNFHIFRNNRLDNYLILKFFFYCWHASYLRKYKLATCHNFAFLRTQKRIDPISILIWIVHIFGQSWYNLASFN